MFTNCIIEIVRLYGPKFIKCDIIYTTINC